MVHKHKWLYGPQSLRCWRRAGQSVERYESPRMIAVRLQPPGPNASVREFDRNLVERDGNDDRRLGVYVEGLAAEQHACGIECVAATVLAYKVRDSGDPAESIDVLEDLDVSHLISE